MIPRKSSAYRGFTFFEVVLALFIIGILSASIILVSNTTLNFSVTVQKSQERDLKSEEVEDHIGRHLREISRDTRISLTMDEANQNVQTLTIKRPQHYFPFEGRDTLARQTDFVGAFNQSGWINLIQFSYATKDDDDHDPGVIEGQEPPDKQIDLVYDLYRLEWHFYDEQYDDWVPEWEENKGIPRKVRLIYQKANESRARTKIIWLPPFLSTN